MKKHTFLLILFIHFFSAGFSQSRLIKGKVSDSEGPLPGITVLVKNVKNNGVVTDKEGNFQIRIDSGDKILVFRSIGYITTEVLIEKLGDTPVLLKKDTKGLDEVVIIGFGQQKRITNTGAVSSISGTVIRQVPTANIQNTLVGRLPGFFSQQRSGQPGKDAADFFIRGANSFNNNQPLVIIDDIESTYDKVAQIDANEIENVTILKDASTTAIYGVRGANGVLVITTRRGRIGMPKINFTAESGFQQVIKMPEYLDAATTATLRNEAIKNDSYGLATPLPQPFTQNDIELFKNGSDPFGHPNVNWVDELLNTRTPQSRFNIDINGGTNLLKYAVSLGYYTQDGIVKDFTPTGSEVNNDYFYRRYNFRSNLDFTPTKTLKIRLDITGRFGTANTPNGVDAKGIIYDISRYNRLAPYAFPVKNPNGSYPFSSYMGGDNTISVMSRLENGGYARNYNNDLGIVAGGEQQLDFITQGLSVKANLSYSSTINDIRRLTRDINILPAYRYNVATDTYTIKNAANARFPFYSLSSGNDAYNNRSIIQAMLNYDRTFDKHHFYSLALFNQSTYIDKAALPINYRGTTLRVGYDFNKKYLMEFVVARNGNDIFAEDKRFGVFPAASIGWNIAEENFFKSAMPFVDLFKLRGSYGLVGSDNTSTIPVISQIYSSGGGYDFGTTSTPMPGIREGSLVNPNITWEKERKLDVGIDLNMFKGKLAITADYFDNYRYDQLINVGDVPLILGQVVPQRNIGETRNRGFDGLITINEKIGGLSYTIGLNASYAKNKIIYVSEAPDYPNLAQTGQPIGAGFGYKNIGFYQTADFDSGGKVKAGIPTPTWSVIQPGDLKYADLNGDGLITIADRTYIARPNLPTTTGGINIGLTYDDFSLSALLQGATDYDVNVFAEGSDAFNSNLRPWHLQRWTPETANTAAYPRIGANSNINNVSWQTPSNFWYSRGGYIRLKSVEFGYDLPLKWIKKVGLQNARIYGTGYNLYTWTALDKRFQQDAEIANSDGGAYPNMATFNFGIRIGL